MIINKALLKLTAEQAMRKFQNYDYDRSMPKPAKTENHFTSERVKSMPFDHHLLSAT